MTFTRSAIPEPLARSSKRGIVVRDRLASVNARSASLFYMRSNARRCQVDAFGATPFGPRLLSVADILSLSTPLWDKAPKQWASRDSSNRGVLRSTGAEVSLGPWRLPCSVIKRDEKSGSNVVLLRGCLIGSLRGVIHPVSTLRIHSPTRQAACTIELAIAHSLKPPESENFSNPTPLVTLPEGAKVVDLTSPSNTDHILGRKSPDTVWGKHIRTVDGDANGPSLGLLKLAKRIAASLGGDQRSPSPMAAVAF